MNPETDDLPGRQIEGVPYTGLVERILQTLIICESVFQAQDYLTTDDIVGLVHQIQTLQGDALIFTGVESEEAKAINSYLLKGASLRPLQ
jgi:hypothetical protein